MVEAQHKISTMKLVDSLQDQALLEELLEISKPPIPPECKHLHYLLATPFRYGCYPKGSRFRREGFTPGVFYGSENQISAAAETAYHRMRFFNESPDTPLPANPLEFTAFCVAYKTQRAIDLAREPFVSKSNDWSHPTNYEPCQNLAEQARAALIEVIAYPSVRDPEKGTNLALLTCKCFQSTEPLARETWHIKFAASGAVARCEASGAGTNLPL